MRIFHLLQYFRQISERSRVDGGSTLRPTTRRYLLTGGIAAVGAAAASKAKAAVSYVELGAANIATRATTVTNNTANSTGLIGNAPNGSTANGLRGLSNDGVGVRGVSTRGIGVRGDSAGASYGVYGRGGYGGIYARGGTYGVEAVGSVGVLGQTSFGVGVRGEATSDGGAVKAIHGKSTGSNSNGVVGEASNGAAAYGVWGISTTGYAGVFSGKVVVTGNLSKGGGSFRIDHPLDPANKYLSHSFVESPDMMNVYNGNVVTDANGLAVIRLPRYFGVLNRDFRYQLTVIGVMAQAIVDREIANNQFTVRSSLPHVKVSWLVTGIRKDPFANSNRIKVEEDKPEHERGTYLHPAEYGKPVSLGVDHQRTMGSGPN